jgi:uncharacterized protein (TIGR00369 family)
VTEQFNAVVPFNRTAGVEVIEMDGGRAVARIAQAPERLNHVGTLHAGALFTLADAASGAVMVSLFGARLADLFFVVRDAEIAFLKPARGTITARAETTEPIDRIDTRIARDGRTDTPVAVTLTDERGLEVARVTVRWHLRKF